MKVVPTTLKRIYKFNQEDTLCFPKSFDQQSCSNVKMMNINRVTIAIFRTENPCVPGSIPGDTTLKIRELQKCDSLFLCRFVPCFKAVL